MGLRYPYSSGERGLVENIGRSNKWPPPLVLFQKVQRGATRGARKVRSLAHRGYFSLFVVGRIARMNNKTSVGSQDKHLTDKQGLISMFGSSFHKTVCLTFNRHSTPGL